MPHHTVLLAATLLLVLQGTSQAFPRDYSIHPFYGNSPHMLEMDFPVNSKFYSALSDNQIPLMGGPPASHPVARHPAVTPPHLVSQNRKFFTKTPARDQHFAKILAQQEQATIRSPLQAMKAASDHAATQNKLRNSLQTSDDDVYEVESAPVMKAAPYQAYRGYDRDMMDIPVRLEIESEMEEPNYPRYGAQKRSHEAEESSLRPGFSARPEYNSQPTAYRGQPQYNSQPERVDNLHFTVGLVQQDEQPVRKPAEHRPYRAAASQRKATHYPSSTHKPSPARVAQHPQQQQHYHQHNQQQQPTAAWLDMGAYSSGMGAFGWYSDVPVGSHP